MSVEPCVHISILERDETALDAVSLMAARMGAQVSVYVDAWTARAGIRGSETSLLLVEPRYVDGDLADFVASLRVENDALGVVLMTTLTADELRATCLPICWQALLQKPFTYSRFEGVMRLMLAEAPAVVSNREQPH